MRVVYVIEAALISRHITQRVYIERACVRSERRLQHKTTTWG